MKTRLIDEESKRNERSNTVDDKPVAFVDDNQKRISEAVKTQSWITEA